MSGPRRRVVAAALAGASVVAGAAVPAADAAAPRVVTVRGVAAAGPARYDKVRVVKVGPRRAKHVLVLVPGTSAGAGYFVPDAQDLVKRLKGWQVWAVDRRENLLEDQSGLDASRAGKLGGQGLFDYYLGWIGNPAAGRHFQPPGTEQTSFARRWGMKTAIGDLHRVVRAARRRGRDVVLGGHSLGGTITAAYATWDFNGRPGAADLKGLVFIDGGSGSQPISVADARERLAGIAQGSPFNDLTGFGLPWTAGVFAATGSALALREPGAASTFASWPPAPTSLLAPVRTTNAAQLGYAVDADTGPKSLALVQAHLGGLAATGDPRPWVDGGQASLRRTARAMNGIRGVDGFAWFHPLRLSLDAGAVNGGVANPAQRALGVRATHGRQARLPIYAYETSLGKGRVLSAARALARRARVPARQVRLVNRSNRDSHCDPIFDDFATNDFLKTVLPFLRRTA